MARPPHAADHWKAAGPGPPEHHAPRDATAIRSGETEPPEEVEDALLADQRALMVWKVLAHHLLNGPLPLRCDESVAVLLAHVVARYGGTPTAERLENVPLEPLGFTH